VRITFGAEEIVLSPDDAVGYCRGILKALGYEFEVQDFPKLLRS
jgi:hypothetical protein